MLPSFVLTSTICCVLTLQVCSVRANLSVKWSWRAGSICYVSTKFLESRVSKYLVLYLLAAERCNDVKKLKGLKKLSDDCPSRISWAHCRWWAHYNSNTLQHIATHCDILHHTAAHCNTLQNNAVANTMSLSDVWCLLCILSFSVSSTVPRFRYTHIYIDICIDIYLTIAGIRIYVTYM